MAEQFCTVARVKEYLNQESGFTGDDTLILKQIESATQLIKAYTRRTWAAGTFVEYFDTITTNVSILQGDGVAKFFLKEKGIDVTEANYPKVRFSTNGQWDSVADIATNLYQVDQDVNAVVMYPAVMHTFGRSIRVTYVAGFAADTDGISQVPENIQIGCAIQAAISTKMVLDNVMGVSRAERKGQTLTPNMTISGLYKEALPMIKSSVRLFT